MKTTQKSTQNEEPRFSPKNRLKNDPDFDKDFAPKLYKTQKTQNPGFGSPAIPPFSLYIEKSCINSLFSYLGFVKPYNMNGLYQFHFG